MQGGVLAQCAVLLQTSGDDGGDLLFLLVVQVQFALQIAGDLFAHFLRVVVVAVALAGSGNADGAGDQHGAGGKGEPKAAAGGGGDGFHGDFLF